MMPQSSDGNVLLGSLPHSILCYDLCPFLTGFDLLAFRATCRSALQSLHDEPESRDIWKQLLVRDFHFANHDTKDECWKHTLRILPVNQNVSSIFGVDPSSDDVVEQVRSTFESWKRWMKANHLFYSEQKRSNEKSSIRFLNAPYFLRAATFWRSIFTWCKEHGDVGKRVEHSLKKKRGLKFHNWRKKLRLRQGIRAAQAVYAFCGGQELGSPDQLDGLFGGYQIDDHYSNSYFVSPSLELGNNLLMIAQCLAFDMHGLPKMFAVDSNTGAMFLVTLTERSNRAVRICKHSQEDEMLLWLENYVAQLHERDIRVGITGSYENGNAKGIPLFPTLLPHDKALITPPPLKTRRMMFPNIPICSRTVTRGIEVIASAVYATQAFQTFGYIYSIQLRLLPKNHKDYSSPKTRGFATCQLLASNIQTTDSATQQTRHIRCQGIGNLFPLYPILSEEGYIEEDTIAMGHFQCQMTTGARGPSRGFLQGALQFVPGSIDAPTGPRFDLPIASFLLDNEPDFVF